MFVYLFYQDIDITIKIMNSAFALAEYYMHVCNITFMIKRIKNFD